MQSEPRGRRLRPGRLAPGVNKSFGGGGGGEETKKRIEKKTRRFLFRSGGLSFKWKEAPSS